MNRDSLQQENNFIVNFTDPSAQDRAHVGGKAARLAMLSQAGFMVPQSLVITTAAYLIYNKWLEHGLQHEALADSSLGSMPDSLQQLILKALQNIGWLSIPLAIRSSAVLEDSATATYAGLFDTYLGVVGEHDVIAAIEKCWTSNQSDHLMQYRHLKDAPLMPMAVLIQPMVGAAASGVAFTANPLTGNRHETLIHAINGIGDGVVSGERTAEEWLVHKGSCKRMRQSEKALSRKQVKALAYLAAKIEQHFASPQDIEWAIANGSIVILQARQLLIAAAAGDQVIPDGYWERESSHFPFPLSPIARTISLPIINRSFRSAFQLVPLLIETLELQEINGFLYQRVVPLGGNDRHSPPDWLMSLLLHTVPSLRKRMKQCEQAISEDKPFQMIEKWHAQDKSDYIQRIQNFRMCNIQQLTFEELSDHLVHLIEFSEETNHTHMLLNASITFVISEFAFICKDLLNWDLAKALELVNGLSTVSTEPVRALAELTNQARENSELLRILASPLGDKLQLIQQIDPQWHEGFQHYLVEFGMRATNYDVIDPVLMEAPEFALKLIQDQLQQAYQPSDTLKALQAIRKAAITEANEHLHSRPDDAAAFHKVLHKAEYTYPLREEHGFYDLSMPLALLRMTLLEVGCRFVKFKFIDEKLDVFYLEYDELQSLMTLGKGQADLQGRIDARKAERLQLIANPGPQSFGKL